jgi:hypothetical protein
MNDTKLDADVAENKRAFAAQSQEIGRAHAGKYVGFAFGRVVIVDSDPERVARALDALDPRPESAAVFLAGQQEPIFEPYFDTYSEFVD